MPRPVFLNLSIILDQGRIGQSFEGTLDCWGSSHDGEDVFYFAEPGSTPHQQQLLVVCIT